MAGVLNIARELAKKLYPMYCQHFNGAFCDICAPELIATALRQRDAEWNRAIEYDTKGPSGCVLSPSEAAGWLKKDRVTRARNVAAARPRRGPMHY